jgi:hypothetical protein
VEHKRGESLNTDQEKLNLSIVNEPVDQTWKKFLAFWASERGDQNPSVHFLQNIRYKEGIMKI